jgi:CRP-like cAMP-binding protein
MLSEPTVAELLSRTELFGRLGQGDQARVVRQMRRVSFRAGQAIFSRGDPGDEIYLVLEGRVRLSLVTAEGRTVSYRHACAGSIFGEIAALDRGVRTADATALASVVARTLSQSSLNTLIRSNPSFARANTSASVCGKPASRWKTSRSIH